MEGSDDELPYKPTTSVPRLQRLVLVALATIESLLTSGVIFGWSALLLLLENEGVYAELCPLEKTCAERTTRFELIFTAASTVFALSVWPTGFVLDRCAAMRDMCRAAPHTAQVRAADQLLRGQRLVLPRTHPLRRFQLARL